MNQTISLLNPKKLRNTGGLFAALFGLPFSLLLSYAIFKPSLFLDVFQEIADFGIEGSVVLWGVIYPFLYLIILFTTGRNLTLTSTESTFQIISKLSFSSTIKVIAVLSFLFVADKIINGISTSVIPITSLIIFSLIALLFVIFIATIINFIVSFLTIRTIQSKLQKQQNTI